MFVIPIQSVHRLGLRPSVLSRFDFPHLIDSRIWGRTNSTISSYEHPKNIADSSRKRRLIVCCDGTWKNASGSIAPLTNVARFARSIDRHGLGREPHTQIVYYAGGVGAKSVLPVALDSLYSGATGEGWQILLSGPPVSTWMN
jgi:hypothetical protein